MVNMPATPAVSHPAKLSDVQDSHAPVPQAVPSGHLSCQYVVPSGPCPLDTSVVNMLYLVEHNRVSGLGFRV